MVGSGKPAGKPASILRLVTLVAVFAALVPAQESTSPASLSEKRIETLRRLIVEQLTANSRSTDFRVARAVLEKFLKDDPCPLRPVELPIREADYRKSAREITAELVAEKYPPPNVDAWDREAADKYPLYAEGQVIAVVFKASPVRKTTVSGPFRGRIGDEIVVGSSRILLRDMEALPENRDEILKFDPKQVQKLRTECVEAKRGRFEQEKAAFEAKVRDLVLEKEKSRAFAKNEKNGYIRVGDRWMRLDDLLQQLITDGREDLLRQKDQEAVRRAREAERVVRAAVASQTAFDEVAATVSYTDPEQLHASLYAAALKKKGAAEAARLEAEQKAEEEAKRKAEAEAEAKAKAEADQKAAETPIEPPAEGRQESVPAAAIQTPRADSTAVPAWFYAALGGVLLVVGAVVGFAFMRREKDAGRVAAKYFKGKSKAHRTFWETVDADPEHVKYVAYRFPTEEQARQALQRLSYIKGAAGGELRASRPIQFGCYPHQDKFVAFVGGAELGYAMWREASAIFPELENAEYFRVSTAPSVDLEIPDIEQLMADEKLKIAFVEQREAKDFAQHHIYSAPSKESARIFLERVAVKSPGVHIVVETPEGAVSKGFEGIHDGYPRVTSAAPTAAAVTPAAGDEDAEDAAAEDDDTQA